MSESKAAGETENQEGDDPSMEEILASIRKIITDEDQPEGEAPQAEVKSEEKAEETAEPEAEAATETEETAQAEEDDDVLELTDEIEPEEEKAEAPEEEAPAPEASQETEDAPMTDEVKEEPSSQDNIDALFDDPPPAPEAEAEPEPEPPAEEPPVAEETEPEEIPEAPEAEEKPNAMAEALEKVGEVMGLSKEDEQRSDSVQQEITDMEETLLSQANAQATAQSLRDLSAQVMLGSGNQSLEAIVKEVLRPLLKEWLNEHLPVIVEKLVRAEIDKITN